MHKEGLKLRVEHYLGESREILPKILFIGAREIQVTEIIDRWIDHNHRYYKTRGNDDGIYLLRYDVARKHWDLTLFDSDTYQETKLSST